jgi:type I restriction enzyme R subunit
MSILNEATVEDAALEYLRQLGYSTAFGPEIAPDGEHSERTAYDNVYLYNRLREAIIRINSGADHELIEETIKRLERAESQNPLSENMRVHALLRDGVPVERRDAGGKVRTELIHLIDFE